MSRPLSILYRGSLVSCNYACGYCPFAKRRESRAEMDRDRAEVERFVAWVAARAAPTSILFTPWGEALVRPWYQEALVRLSRLDHVERVAIQTNLSAPLDWVLDPAGGADLEALALWATYHPSQVDRSRFVAKSHALVRAGVRHSVGIVGLREHLGEAEALRAEVDPAVYVWVNAYKRQPDYYADAERARLLAVDPLFATNAVRHPSLGRPCRTGEHVVSVDGAGRVRRCHFVDDLLGNIYAPGWEAALGPRPCPNQTCGCHIGYAHLEPLGLDAVFGAGLLERIPAAPSRRALPLASGA